MHGSRAAGRGLGLGLWTKDMESKAGGEVVENVRDVVGSKAGGGVEGGRRGELAEAAAGELDLPVLLWGRREELGSGLRG